MEKLCKMAKRIDWIMKALQILIVVLTVLLASLALFGFISNSVSGNWPLRFSDPAFIPGTLAGFLVFTGVEIVALYGLHIFRRILQPMKQGEPFAEGVSADMRRFGWIVLIPGSLLIDPMFLFLGAVVFLFSYIFRYGEELQRQVDETL